MIDEANADRDLQSCVLLLEDSPGSQLLIVDGRQSEIYANVGIQQDPKILMCSVNLQDLSKASPRELWYCTRAKDL